MQHLRHSVSTQRSDPLKPALYLEVTNLKFYGGNVSSPLGAGASFEAWAIWTCCVLLQAALQLLFSTKTRGVFRARLKRSNE